MIKRNILLLTLIILSLSTYSQDCLENARIDFKEGKVQNVVDKLAPCLESGSIEDNNKKDAYLLLILSYLYLNDQEKASNLMGKLLDFDPQYIPTIGKDPPELWELFYSFTVRPSWAIGLKAGINTSLPEVITTFTLDDFPTTEGKYLAGTSFNISLFVSKPFSERVELFLQPTYMNTNVKYENSSFGFADITTSETQTMVKVPLAFKFNLGNRSDFTKPNKKLNPFVYLGGGISYLMSSSINATRRDEVRNQGYSIEPITEDFINLRNQLNYTILGGIGIEYRMKKGGHISLDVNYQYSLNNQVNTENRYDGNLVLFEYGYLDSDLRVNHLMISLGYIHSFYKPHKKKKKQKPKKKN